MMKYIGRNEQAVSPIVGILMLTGITFIMSAIVLVIALSFQPPPPPPMAAILASPEFGTTGVLDISITHSGGDRLAAGDWWISVVPTGNQPVYRQSSTDFTVGDDINARIGTDGTGVYTVTRNSITVDGVANPISRGEYDVSIVVYQYNAEIMHAKVVVNG